MVEVLWLRWVLTVPFVATGVHCLARCWVEGVRRRALRGPTAWLVEVTHLAMSAAMIAMAWVGVGWDRTGVQAALFLLLGGGFAARAALGPATPGTRTELGHEVVMAAAMTWMLLRMADHAGHHGPHESHAGGGGWESTGLPDALTVVLLVLLAGAAAVWALRLVAALRVPQGRALLGRAGVVGSHLLMSAGMAAATVTLL
ncbi:DUF5134 domain-containing protein [Micromonospora sp. WMMD975]|uniref:DUF5134 domain-containing protein n=1 Tax=Micromonospora sp. WMMD975 TaxID=3016087 RepID=UPI00249C0FA6|nr:DUF5134 domain-containing protein [Micromonospora sp. WMMD975]WFE30930.1 DUF5134 domain-containing protein [Micromonospora sp. WMMD975]